jgi:hypothetical protein
VKAISVNRLVGICFPMYYNKIFSRRKIWFEIAFTWMFAPLLLAPFFFNNGFQEGFSINNSFEFSSSSDLVEPSKRKRCGMLELLKNREQVGRQIFFVRLQHGSFRRQLGESSLSFYCSFETVIFRSATCNSTG